LAARLANQTVAEYVNVHQQQKIAAYAEAYNFAQQRLPTLKQEMLEKSALVDKFRQEHAMVAGQYATIRREKLTEASKQLVDAQNKLEQLKAQAAEAKTGDPLSNPGVLASLAIQRMREQKSQIMTEAAAKPSAWAPIYAMRAEAVDGQIRAEANRIVASLPGQLAAQQAAVNSQMAEYRSIQLEVSQMDRLQSELDPLENDARIAIRQYNDFKSSDSATKPELTFVGVNVRVLSAAAVPYRPYFPNNTLLVPVAFVLSFGCVTGLSLYRGRRVGFANTLQVRESLRVMPIGRIPYRTRRMERAYWESLMALSMHLFPPYEEPTPRQTILVTSARPNEGKSTISAGLAQVLIQRNISVALVDADLRVVRGNRKGQAAAAGLGDVLRQALTLDDVVIKRSGISLIPAGMASPGASPADPTALIASNLMAQVLRTLQATHDVVIIDGPPALVGGDVYALSRLVTRILFVIKQSDTNERQVEEAFAAICKAPEEIGVVLNMIRSTGDDDDELAFSPRMIEYYASPVANRSQN
jgi:Mrp family chromosome partitioning ATPase